MLGIRIQLTGRRRKKSLKRQYKNLIRQGYTWKTNYRLNDEHTKELIIKDLQERGYETRTITEAFHYNGRKIKGLGSILAKKRTDRTKTLKP